VSQTGRLGTFGSSLLSHLVVGRLDQRTTETSINLRRGYTILVSTTKSDDTPIRGNKIP